jgi:hypothetical protein
VARGAWGDRVDRGGYHAYLAGFSLRSRPIARVRDHVMPAAVAQLVEQRTFNPKVVGSNPTGGIEKYLQKGFPKSLSAR